MAGGSVIESLEQVEASYDAVADEYVRRISGELASKPFDRALLDRFAARFAAGDRVAELGCGPGHVARYLHQRGVAMSGWDLSGALVDAARRLNPDIAFHCCDFRHLPVPDGSWAGIVAFYSLIHLPVEEIVPTLCEWRRVLEPGGLLLVAVHLGGDSIHLAEWWGRRVDVTFRLFRAEDVRGHLEAAGFRIEECVERDPYPGVEAETRRLYVLASKPLASTAER
ncbi:MAG: class I SAM-dependent methyltransferase [bacterium]